MADFVSTLIEMRNGAVASDCSRKLTELITAILETGKKGKLTLNINVVPSRLSLGKVTEVEIDHDCKVSKPELSTGRSIFYSTPDGQLLRNDPSQAEFELEDAKHA